jgi:hypothetical protein
MSWLDDPDTAIAQFEQGQVDVATFDHAAHVRLAWSYLQRMDPFEANRRFSSALERLTRSIGATDKFNATVTGFFIFLIAERIAREPGADWSRFRDANADLINGAGSLLAAHYTPQRLQSDTAKSLFLMPDRSASQESATN